MNDGLNGFSNGHMGTNGGGMDAMSSAAQSLGMQWNPKHLEIKTRTVEKTLEPLVMQVGDEYLKYLIRIGS